MFKAVTALKLSGDRTDRQTETHTDTAFYSLGYTHRHKFKSHTDLGSQAAAG